MKNPMHMRINAHKIIDDIQETERLYTQNGGKKKLIEHILNLIRDSQKFFMGGTEQLHQLTKNFFPNEKFRPFLEENEYEYFPYKCNYFEYYIENSKDNQLKLPCILIVDYNREKSIFQAYKIDRHFYGFDGRPTFWIYPIAFHVQMGKCFEGDNKNIELLQIWDPREDGNLKQLLEKEVFEATFQTVMMALFSTVRFLNTKGVEVKINHPSKKLQKKRQKKNKEPFFSYHTLVLNPQAPKTKYPGREPQGLWKNPLHSVREYEKTYTEEAPLFGRVVGKVKVAPFLRGDYRIGVKLKDYEIKEDLIIEDLIIKAQGG